MSDNENPPSKQTSSVPLKKETVRVTLKAADAPAASPTGAPPAPAAPKPTVGPPKAPTPTKPPTATAPAATVGPAKAPAPAPTIPLKTAAGTTTGAAPAAAPTIRLNTPATAPAAPSAPTAPGAPPKPAAAPTAPLKAPGAPTAPGSAPAPGPTIALPKATVQLNPPTQPLGTQGPAASQMATMPVSEEEESTGSPLLSALSIIGFLGAAAVIAIQLMTANVWLTKDAQGKTTPAEWGRLF